MQTHSRTGGLGLQHMNFGRGQDSTHHHLIRPAHQEMPDVHWGQDQEGRVQQEQVEPRVGIKAGLSRPDMAAGLWCGEGLEAPHGSSLSALFNMSEAMMEGIPWQFSG